MLKQIVLTNFRPERSNFRQKRFIFQFYSILSYSINPIY